MSDYYDLKREAERLRRRMSPDGAEEEKTAEPNKIAVLLKNCGKIVWIAAAGYLCVMLMVSMALGIDTHSVLDTLACLSSATVASAGGFIFGAMLMGFGELVDIFSDMRDTLKKNMTNNN